MFLSYYILNMINLKATYVELIQKNSKVSIIMLYIMISVFAIESISIIICNSI